jgi:large subunit ribosomal protein L21
MYAVVETGGKQYRVAEGDVLKVEKLIAEEGDAVVLESVSSVVNDGELILGKPYIQGAKITAKVIMQGRGKKIRIFKYKAKSNYRRRQGHRQSFTKLLIEKIEA